MHALVTNDDGIDSPGLTALAQVALTAGLDVTVAAPSWDSSGASASLTAVETDSRLLLERRSLPEVSDIGCFAVEATPAFIVNAGLHGAFGDPPDLVLSGINLGQNTGASVLHSGTVGAVFTAATQGGRGIAVSLAAAGTGLLRWETAARVAEQLIPWLLEADTGVVLNVNVPNVARSEVRGVKRAHLSSLGTVQATVTELEAGHVQVSYTQPNAEYEPGTDAALLSDGFACYTPLQAPCQASEVDTTGLAGAPATYRTTL